MIQVILDPGSAPMLKKLAAAFFYRRQRFWTVDEIRELVVLGDLTGAMVAAKQLNPMTPQREWIQACILAEIAFRQNRDDDALTGFQEVLKVVPGFADAHYGLSLLMLEQGHSEVAIEHAQFAKNASPNDARYLAQLGLCHITIGNFPSAESPLNDAVRLNKKDKASWNNLGLVLRAKGLPGAAHACFLEALKLDLDFAAAQQNMERLHNELADAGVSIVENASAKPLAEPVENEIEKRNETQAGLLPWELRWREVDLLKKAGNSDSAIAVAEEICMDWPMLASPVCLLARLYRNSGDSHGGIDALQNYLLTHPINGEALGELGASYLATSDFSLAEAQLTKAFEIDNANPAILSDLALALVNQSKYAEALVYRRMAVSLEPSIVMRAHLAATLVTACHYSEAIELFDALIEEDPESKDIFLLSYAVALSYVGRCNDALALLDELIAQQPNAAALRLQRAQTNLLLGNFKTGWEDYAFRGLAYNKQFRVLPFTKWRGEALEGKSIVVLAEQGLGDQIMLASCLPDLLALMPSRVVLEAIGRVAPTLARSFPACEVIHTRQDKSMDWARDLGHVDYFVPLGDLPQYFRNSVESFPASPYLRPDLTRVAYWRGKLCALGGRPNVGVSWRGGVQATRQVMRTMTPTDLAPLGEGIDANWICLQYGCVDDDLKIAEAAGFKMSYWSEAIADLDEFAALLDALDCIVTVCNTTVHYAGALGKPVVVLAPQVPEWRYGLKSLNMPWYVDACVLRQKKMGEWGPLVRQANQLLSDKFGSALPKLSLTGAIRVANG